MAMDAISLPAEIWLEIFALATSGSHLLESNYRAFQPVQYQIQTDMRLKTLSTLCVVCKRWKALATTLLYREVKIRHGSRDLFRVLEMSAANSGSTDNDFTNGDTVRVRH